MHAVVAGVLGRKIYSHVNMVGRVLWRLEKAIDSEFDWGEVLQSAWVDDNARHRMLDFDGKLHSVITG